MQRFPLVTAWLIVLGSALTSFAGKPYEALDVGDVFVATIMRVEDQGATHAQPPRVWLDVHEVLRGEIETNRSPAIWEPHYHGIDYGDGDSPELLRWNAVPMEGPKVGEKFILGGWAQESADGDKKSMTYRLFAFVRIPYSAKARQKALDNLKVLEDYKREYAAKQAVEAKEHVKQVASWRAAADTKTIEGMTQQADAVVIATGGGYGDHLDFKVERMLKGRPRMSSSGTYYVSIPSKEMDKRLLRFVYAPRGSFVMFLSEEYPVAGVYSVLLKLVDPYRGVVLADDAAIKAIEASLKKYPPLLLARCW